MEKGFKKMSFLSVVYSYKIYNVSVGKKNNKKKNNENVILKRYCIKIISIV